MEQASTPPTKESEKSFADVLAGLPASAALKLRKLATKLQFKGKGQRKRSAERLALKRYSQHNPAGSKLVRRWMKNATGERMTFAEANRRYGELR